MMTADKLNQLRGKVKRGELLDRDQQLAVIDHGLGALTEMAGGQSVLDRQNLLKVREQQVHLALVDLRKLLATTKARVANAMPRDGMKEVDPGLTRAIFTLDMIKEMIKAKGPAWYREWSFYTPRIAEEFDVENEKSNQ